MIVSLLKRLPLLALLTCAGFSFDIGRLSADEKDGIIRDPNWSIEIRPAARALGNQPPSGPTLVPAAFEEAAPVPESVANEPKPIGPPPLAAPQFATTVVTPPRMTYAEAYGAVPFNRAEYEANPGYRHQAAVELMFGVLRPTTMVQQYTPRASRYPDFYQMPYGRSDTQHINVRSFGGGYNFNGQSPFGYPYGVRGNW
jgi:hypothetical protein